MTQKVIQRQDLMLDRWLLEIKPAQWAEGQHQTGDGTIGISVRNPLGPWRKGMGSFRHLLSSLAKRDLFAGKGLGGISS